MARSGMTVAQAADHKEPEPALFPGTPVEIRRDGSTTPGLVRQWRIDGTQAVHQERVVVVTKAGGEIKEIDVARDFVSAIDGEDARLIEEVLGDVI